MRDSTESECLPPCGVGYAVIALSKTVDVGRDHLIHRKRSPFPYEGKALTRSKRGETANVGRDTFHFALG